MRCRISARISLTPNDDYPDFVIPLAQAVAAGTVDRGVAVCGSGVGATVCANKIKGVRACLIEDHFSAKQGVEDDNLNIICLGGRIEGPELAWDLVKTFLDAEFSQALRHLRRLHKVERAWKTHKVEGKKSFLWKTHFFGAGCSSPSLSPIITCFRSSRWGWPGSSSISNGGICAPAKNDLPAPRDSGRASSASTSPSASSPAFRWNFSLARTGPAFSKFSGNIIGQTLAMEGMFAFFLESAMIGAMVWGEKRLGPRKHFLATLGVALGSWLSGLFHSGDERIHAASRRLYHGGRWLIAAGKFRRIFAEPLGAGHVPAQPMRRARDRFICRHGRGRALCAARQTRGTSFAISENRHAGRVVLPAFWSLFPPATGRRKWWRNHQPVTLAAMEGRFDSGTNAELKFHRPAGCRRTAR